jgi:hypothetical protein
MCADGAMRGENTPPTHGAYDRDDHHALAAAR